MAKSKINTPAAGYKIVVIDAGWVICGDVTAAKDECGLPGLAITNGSVIRRWGTQRGLGQLAIQGKQEETQLDPVGSAFVPHGKILFTIDSVRLEP